MCICLKKFPVDISDVYLYYQKHNFDNTNYVTLCVLYIGFLMLISRKFEKDVDESTI